MHAHPKKSATSVWPFERNQRKELEDLDVDTDIKKQLGGDHGDLGVQEATGIQVKSTNRLFWDPNMWFLGTYCDWEMLNVCHESFHEFHGVFETHPGGGCDVRTPDVLHA